MQLFFFMILLQNLQAHSQVYVNGKLLNLEKLLESKLFLFCSPQRRAENEMKCLLLQLKSLSAKRASRHPTAQLLVKCVSLTYLVDKFFFIFLFLVLLKEMRSRGQLKISSCCLV